MTIKGIRFKLHFSWYIIFVLLSWGLSKSYFGTLLPEQSQFYHALMGVIATLALFGSVLIHELAHSFVARAYGLKTKSITLYFFGGIATLEREPHTATSDLFVSVAGPVASLVLALIFFVFSVSPLDRYLREMNLLIGVFNLIPVMPLDGGRILRGLVWKIRKRGFLDAMSVSLKVGRYLIYIILAILLYRFVKTKEGLLMMIILGVVHLISDNFYKEVSAVRKHEDISVKDIHIRRENIVCIPLEQGVKVYDFFRKYFFKYGFHGFPVVNRYGEIQGLITYWFIMHRLREKEITEETSLDEIYEPFSESMTISEGVSLKEALEKMYMENRERLFSVNDKREITGLITKSVITRMKEVKIRREAR